MQGQIHAFENMTKDEVIELFAFCKKTYPFHFIISPGYILSGT